MRQQIIFTILFTTAVLPKLSLAENVCASFYVNPNVKLSLNWQKVRVVSPQHHWHADFPGIDFKDPNQILDINTFKSISNLTSHEIAGVATLQTAAGRRLVAVSGSPILSKKTGTINFGTLPSGEGIEIPLSKATIIPGREGERLISIFDLDSLEPITPTFSAKTDLKLSPLGSRIYDGMNLVEDKSSNLKIIYNDHLNDRYYVVSLTGNVQKRSYNWQLFKTLVQRKTTELFAESNLLVEVPLLEGRRDKPIKIKVFEASNHGLLLTEFNVPIQRDEMISNVFGRAPDLYVHSYRSAPEYKIYSVAHLARPGFSSIIWIFDHEGKIISKSELAIEGSPGGVKTWIAKSESAHHLFIKYPNFSVEKNKTEYNFVFSSKISD